MVDRNDFTHASVAGFHDRVSQKAYEIWLAEGCPHGNAERHWQQAEQYVTLEAMERQQEQQRQDELEHEYESQPEEVSAGVGTDGDTDTSVYLDTGISSRQGMPARAGRDHVDSFSSQIPVTRGSGRR